MDYANRFICTVNAAMRCSVYTTGGDVGVLLMETEIMRSNELIIIFFSVAACDGTGYCDNECGIQKLCVCALH